MAFKSFRHACGAFPHSLWDRRPSGGGIVAKGEHSKNAPLRGSSGSHWIVHDGTRYGRLPSVDILSF